MTRRRCNKSRREKELEYAIIAIAFIALALLGTGLIIWFLGTKIIWPSISLSSISDEIRYNEDQRNAGAGYYDVTIYDENIEELYELRDSCYYNSKDIVIKWFSMLASFPKLLVLISSIIIVILLILLWVSIIRFFVEVELEERKRKQYHRQI